MDLELQGKTAIVTGGSRGIGKAIARALADPARPLLLTATKKANVEPLCLELQAGGCPAGPLELDLARPEQLARLEAASVAPTQADVDARLPWRYAQFALRDDIAANAAALRRVDAFDKAADALLAAHAALIDDFDKLDGASRLAQVSAFVAQVQAIEDDVGAL